uniref:Uncharacterized protein n=1 Tax=Chromera velia CCMP2878 TaxID=1169474 RepID=A0A0G4FNU2_9ALVE|eukprot:Cvel_17821.t1-p1 / transcript=Cvel_17821.t1 / gene=Cvel_17821 / organism=Chromera_velia_CCMP2878 / gene_product=hypothetical protein / transcript_product=hypothetical protein / location=Cvel_scaffold1444:10973-13756(+) / protein_length=470 / sequence_SO=supercontig / SO=protein_coding / is_pseudo=false
MGNQQTLLNQRAPFQGSESVSVHVHDLIDFPDLQSKDNFYVLHFLPSQGSPSPSPSHHTPPHPESLALRIPTTAPVRVPTPHDTLTCRIVEATHALLPEPDPDGGDEPHPSPSNGNREEGGDALIAFKHLRLFSGSDRDFTIEIEAAELPDGLLYRTLVACPNDRGKRGLAADGGWSLASRMAAAVGGSSGLPSVLLSLELCGVSPCPLEVLEMGGEGLCASGGDREKGKSRTADGFCSFGGLPSSSSSRGGAGVEVDHARLCRVLAGALKHQSRALVSRSKELKERRTEVEEAFEEARQAKAQALLAGGHAAAPLALQRLVGRSSSSRPPSPRGSGHFDQAAGDDPVPAGDGGDLGGPGPTTNGRRTPGPSYWDADTEANSYPNGTASRYLQPGAAVRKGASGLSPSKSASGASLSPSGAGQAGVGSSSSFFRMGQPFWLRNSRSLQVALQHQQEQHQNGGEKEGKQEK